MLGKAIYWRGERLSTGSFCRRMFLGAIRRLWAPVNNASFFVSSFIMRWVVLPMIYSPKLNRYDATPLIRNVPRFLVLRHKYFRGGERYGDSNEETFVSGPLRSAKVAECIEYFYDLDYSGGVFGDSKLVDLVTQISPDLMILSSYSPFNRKQPHVEVLRAIRSKCRVPILGLLPDTISQGDIDAALYMSDLIDLNIMLDSGELANSFTKETNYLRLWTALDFSVFHPGPSDRDILVSFVGSTLAYRSIRNDYLDFLKENNVHAHYPGGQHNPISLEEYSDILRRSKIALNFSYSISGAHQLKGRVFETMFSGTLLLESKNSETKQYFTPMVDYVEFDSKEDLLDKVRYYLRHEDERQEIAMNGYRKATTEYNHDVFWAKVMGKLGELDLLRTEPVVSNRVASAQ